MNESERITSLERAVRTALQGHLRGVTLAELASIDSIQTLVMRLVKELTKAAFEGWNDALEEVAMELALPCPKCGGRRRVEKRPGREMKIHLLGFELPVAKLYVECPRCEGAGVSITRLLTGLHSGDAPPSSSSSAPSMPPPSTAMARRAGTWRSTTASASSERSCEGWPWRSKRWRWNTPTSSEQPR